VNNRDFGEVVKGLGGPSVTIPRQLGDGSDLVMRDYAMAVPYNAGNSNIRYGSGSEIISLLDSENS